jgi:ubiquinone/menaquinone biosynthesis C-methylase UbiE
MAQEEFLENPMPDIIEQWRYYFSVLNPQPDDVIIDVGCNTGDAEKELLTGYPKIRKVFGIDNNGNRYIQALAKWKADGSSTKIEFKLADAQDLPFPDDYFDRGYCVDTLEWIKDPLRGLQEMRRVTKPGGSFILIHSDFDTQVFNSGDRQICRKIVHGFSDAGPNGQMGRELFGLCQTVGFRSVRPIVYTLVNTEWRPNLYGYKAAHTMVDWLVEKTEIPKGDLDRWMVDLETQNSKGTYFYSINRNICYCEK